MTQPDHTLRALHAKTDLSPSHGKASEGTPSLLLSTDYLLLKKAYECLAQNVPEGDTDLMQALAERLEELYPTVPPAPERDPRLAKFFLCEHCGSALQLVRVAYICETIAIAPTGQLIWASELLTSEDGRVPSFEVQYAYVRCRQCYQETSHIDYDALNAQLTILCSVCEDSFYPNERADIVEDAQGHPRLVCSRNCKETFLAKQ